MGWSRPNREMGIALNPGRAGPTIVIANYKPRRSGVVLALNQLLLAARESESGKADTLLAICVQTAAVT
jgi:hypothetical protein